MDMDELDAREPHVPERTVSEIVKDIAHLAR